MKRSGALAAGVGLAVVLTNLALATGTASAVKHHKTAPSGPETIAAVPATAVEIPGKSVGFAIEGTGWFASEAVGVWAPGLAGACAANSSWLDWGNASIAAYPGIAGQSDDNGRFALVFTGVNCPPGSYAIKAEDEATPYRRTSAVVTITASSSSAAGIAVSPATEQENDVGWVATTLSIQGLTPAETVTVDAPQLALYCGGDPNLWIFANAQYGSNPPDSQVTLDASGGAVLGVTGEGCVAGTYPVTVTENPSGTVHRSAFTITAP
jgi:hypothetical protein